MDDRRLFHNNFGQLHAASQALAEASCVARRRAQAAVDRARAFRPATAESCGAGLRPPAAAGAAQQAPGRVKPF